MALLAAEPHATAERKRELRTQAVQKARQGPLFFDLTLSFSNPHRFARRLALAGWPVSRRTAGSPLASCLYIWRIRVPHLPDDNRRDAAANEHDAKERHRDHLAEHIFSHAVPGHRRADGPVRPKRAPRRRQVTKSRMKVGIDQEGAGHACYWQPGERR
jgi:hypothetical protein